METQVYKTKRKTTENIALKNRWNDICNEYLKLFCEKHEYSYSEYDTDWVCDNPGTVVMIGDLFVGMEDLRYDVDNNIDPDFFEKWYWKNLEVYELTGNNYMNYPSFCKGAPDYYDDERMENIRKAKANVFEAQKVLDDEIRKFKQDVNERKNRGNK